VKIKYNEHETTAHHGWSHTVQRFSFEASPVMGRRGKQYRAEDALRFGEFSVKGFWKKPCNNVTMRAMVTAFLGV